jgi:hypothetical protein
VNKLDMHLAPACNGEVTAKITHLDDPLPSRHCYCLHKRSAVGRRKRRLRS